MGARLATVPPGGKAMMCSTTEHTCLEVDNLFTLKDPQLTSSFTGHCGLIRTEPQCPKNNEVKCVRNIE